MTLFIRTLFSGVLQFSFILLIAFLWWWLSARRQQRFTQWIGLTAVKGGMRTFLLAVFTLIILFTGSTLILKFLPHLNTATTQFEALGWAAIPSIIVYSSLNTSCWEEIFFRSLLLKRVMKKCGFVIANIFQATLFGLMHGIPMYFMLRLTIPHALLITLITGLGGWLMGYMNEKSSQGSILPSWMLHFTGNIIAGVLSAFSIL